ncbi:MAG: NAD-binding protein [Pseudomonadales bacterium]
MRAVFIGASLLARATTELLVEEGHEVVIVEKDLDVIETYADQYDCSFLHGDGSRPAVLEDVDPNSTDCLYCVSNDDTANILAAVVAKSMEFSKIVVRVEDRDLLPVCKQLSIEHVIVPDLKVAKDLIAFGCGDSDNLDTFT